MIRFARESEAQVELRIYDGRDWLVASVGGEGRLPPGDHELAWDGRDGEGRLVPPEAYTYVLVATAPSGEVSRWDPTDLTGGTNKHGQKPLWDPDAGVVRYRLDEASRVRIRVGLARGGPLLATLVDWVPRGAGSHAEAWDGWDASRVLDLARHPALAFSLSALTLSRNTLMVGPPPREVALIADLPEPPEQRERTRVRPRQMLDFAGQAIEHRRDFSVKIRLPETLRREPGSGLPVVTGPVPVLLEVAPAHAARLLDERFEAVFFVDGLLVFETETAFLPLTWTWDPRDVHDGPHSISVNLRSYEGHFGLASLRLELETETKP